ncbi:MAG: leucyl aminopeptidase [Rhodobacteraceae bacterium]|nr:leucyl aminopeptidase [Paracoccaceae bacterium]
MTTPIAVNIIETNLEDLAAIKGRIVVLLGKNGQLDVGARRVNRLCKGAVKRFAESDAGAEMKPATARDLAYPAGLAATALQIVRLDRNANVDEARRAGAAIGRAAADGPVTVLAGALRRPEELALGMTLRAYDYADMRSDKKDSKKSKPSMTMMVTDAKSAKAAAADVAVRAAGVFFTRDLVSAPANVLTTNSFADQLVDLKSTGLKVEVLDEPALEKLGMASLLAVGMGSESPSKVVVMQHLGGKKGDAPLALVGKGVVFDTGGISMKPAGGMEDMTMDMGGAGTVAGTMKTLAMRKAKANVIGIVGLVENMPDGRAQHPGDIVKSMKGDTIEVINTDAEGRLVLCDVMWYVQEKYKPAAMVDLATLTGAVIIALGHENTGVFSNDDPFCNALLKAANAEGEGAWRLPLADAYDKQLKSDKADMKNVGGRAAGSITAAQFLQRFVKDDTPWCHLDIAGTAQVKAATKYAPKGATGWGVLTLDRLVRDRYEPQG